VAPHSELNEFQSCPSCREVSQREIFAKLTELPLAFEIVFSSRYPRFGTKTDLKLTALRCLKAPDLSSQSDKIHAKLRLLYQSVYQSPCSAIRHLCILPQST